MRKFFICLLFAVAVPVSLFGQLTETSKEPPAQPSVEAANPPIPSDGKASPATESAEPLQARDLEKIRADITACENDWKRKEAMYEIQNKRLNAEKTELQNRFSTINQMNEQKIQALTKQNAGSSEDKDQIKQRIQQIQAEKQAEVEKHRQLISKTDQAIQAMISEKENELKKQIVKLDSLKKEEEAAKGASQEK